MMVWSGLQLTYVRHWKSMSGEENLLIGNDRARASRVGGIKKVVSVTVAQTAPTRLDRVRIFNNLFSMRRVACYNRHGPLPVGLNWLFYFQNYCIIIV